HRLPQPGGREPAHQRVAPGERQRRPQEQSPGLPGGAAARGFSGRGFADHHGGGIHREAWVRQGGGRRAGRAGSERWPWRSTKPPSIPSRAFVGAGTSWTRTTSRTRSRSSRARTAWSFPEASRGPALERLREGDHRGYLVRAVGGEPAVAEAPITMVLTGIPWRTTWKYTERGYRHLFWDAGMILANLLALASAAAPPAEVILGFVDDGVGA